MFDLATQKALNEKAVEEYNERKEEIKQEIQEEQEEDTEVDNSPYMGFPLYFKPEHRDFSEDE